MLPLRGLAVSLASLIVLATAQPASAGWQSVFQVCCHSCSTPYVSSYSAYYGNGCCDPCTSCYECCNPCPQYVATTNYVQRCYYTPTTSYCTKTYYEPCTTYRTSYYYEPVTCYRYSCCYDPCTCCYKRVATAYTSYRLRSQCCPVTSYVQRCCQVPVTTYQKCCYWEAQTCYSLVDPCTGRAISANGVAPAVSAPAVTETPSGTTAPAVQEYRPAAPAPGSSGSPLYDRQPPPATLPEGSGSSLRKSNQPVPSYARPAPKPVVPKYDRIAFDTAPGGSSTWNLAGQVVAENTSTPKRGARLLFVSEAPTGQQQTASTDSDGKFKVTLASGGWLVYLRDAQGKAVFHSRVQVKGSEAQRMTLVSR